MIWRDAAVTQSLLEDPLLSLPDRHNLKGSAFRDVVTRHVMQYAMFPLRDIVVSFVGTPLLTGAAMVFRIRPISGLGLEGGFPLLSSRWRLTLLVFVVAIPVQTLG